MDPKSANSQNPYSPPAISSETKETSHALSRNKPNEPLVEPIKISGVMTSSDTVVGSQLAQSNDQDGCRNLFLTLGIFALLGLLVFLGGFHATSFTDMSEKLSGFFCSLSFPYKGFIGFVALWLIAFLFLKWKYRKVQIALPHPRVEGTIDEDRLTANWDDLVTATVKWTAISKFIHLKMVVVLFFKNSGMHFTITRDLFHSQHDWNCFIGLLDRKLTRC